MTKLEKLFLKNCKDNMRYFNSDNFKKDYKELYSSIIQTLNEVNLKNVKDNYLVLLSKGINKQSFKLNKPIVFIFGGIYRRGKEDVMLLEKITGNGTTYFNDSKLIRQIRDYKIGTRIGIEKTENGYNMVLPDYFNNVGLFEE